MDKERLERHRDSVVDKVAMVLASDDYADLGLKWELIEPGWGIEDAPLESTLMSFEATAMLIVEDVLDHIMEAIIDVREHCDMDTAWRFRESALMLLINRLPLVARILTISSLRDSVSAMIGGRFPLGTFEAWLENNQDRPGEVGALAELVLNNTDWPVGAEDLSVYMRYLMEKEGGGTEIMVLSAAWRAYTDETELDWEGVPLYDLITVQQWHFMFSEYQDLSEMTTEQITALITKMNLGPVVSEDDEYDEVMICLTHALSGRFDLDLTIAASKAARFLRIRDFIQENIGGLIASDLATEADSEGGFEVKRIVLKVLATTPVSRLPMDPRTESGLSFEGVIALVRETEEEDFRQGRHD